MSALNLIKCDGDMSNNLTYREQPSQLRMYEEKTPKDNFEDNSIELEFAKSFALQGGVNEE